MDIEKIIEAQRQIDKLTGANKVQKELLERFDTRSLSALSRQHDWIAEFSRNHLSTFANSPSFQESLRLAQKSISQLALENLHGFQNSSIQSARKLIEETFQPFSRSNLISEKIKNDFNQLRESLSSPLYSRQSDFLRGFEEITKATMLSSVEVFSKTLLDKNLLKNENLLRQVSNSLLSYDRFANNTLAKLNLELDNSVASALKGSLTLANEQMLRSTSAIQSYIENSNISNFDKSSLIFDREFPKVNRYRIQKQELLQRDDIEEDEDYESLVIKSPSAISFELISSCMSLIVLCNEATRILKGEDIFTLTNTFFEATWKLPTIIPTNKDNFAILVDSLYFILVEGAGKDFLRFVDYKDGKHSGYFNNTEPEVEVIWKIKHLRNKWLRHDIEHGKDTKKDYKIRKETLEWFGLQKVPQSKDEFIFLYNNLIFKVEEFLKLLFERVSKFSN